jgi:protein SCO1/2
MTDTRETRPAFVALALVVASTAAWWALALWPAGAEAPPWLAITREWCFGIREDALPDRSGWLLLAAQPLGMTGLLMALWGGELRTTVRRLVSTAAGQVLAGVVVAGCVAGLAGAAGRIIDRDREVFAANAGALAAPLTRVDDPAPALTLTDQSGRQVALESFRGRPVLVAFAYAHCATVCPLVVSEALTARDRFDRDAPVVLIVTLDPWRDTPSRLPSIATQWALSGDAHVLSGPPELVERTLSTWRVPRTRNVKTGEISHPAMVYVIGRNGRIAYALSGNADAISAAVRAL